ncbi:hypothetical protein TomMM35A_03720 [Sphingobium sp. TomMM35A]
MRYSAAALAALAFANLAAGQVRHYAARSPYFCGTPPPGWTPPEQRRGQGHDINILGCHTLIGERSRALKDRARRRSD